MDGDKILKATEALDSIVGVVTSYKAKLIAAGFNEVVAEQMCLPLNAGLMAQLLSAAAANAARRPQGRR